MSDTSPKRRGGGSGDGLTDPSHGADPNPPTVAAFSPPTTKTVTISHPNTPLLIATPPQITRALSQSYPYVRVANEIMGLLTWTTKDPWESFLMVAGFWGIVLYGDVVVRYGGLLLGVAILGLGILLRGYKKADSHPSLDDILKALETLTARLNIFFSPFYNLTAYITTRRAAGTSTSTGPVLITLAIRCLFVSPVWLLLSVYPFRIITTRRIILSTGTVLLSWHSRPAKVTRTILWRSRSIRLLCEKLTGLNFTSAGTPPPLPPRNADGASTANNNRVSARASLQSVLASSSSPQASNSKTNETDTSQAHKLDYSSALSPSTSNPGVKFTFVIYENQRRWLGVGWTSSLFAYERAPWTDEHLQPCAPLDEFQLPETPAGSGVRWKWVDGEDWRVDLGEEKGKGSGWKEKGLVKQEIKDRLGADGAKDEGWVYYDNKWRDGKRGADGWGKYTRRRKWYRNAELVEDNTPPEPKLTVTKSEPTPVVLNAEKVEKS